MELALFWAIQQRLAGAGFRDRGGHGADYPRLHRHRCGPSSQAADSPVVVAESRSRLSNLSTHAKWLRSSDIAAELLVSDPDWPSVRSPTPKHGNRRPRLLARRHFSPRRTIDRTHPRSRPQAAHRHLPACAGREARGTTGDVRSRDPDGCRTWSAARAPCRDLNCSAGNKLHERRRWTGALAFSPPLEASARLQIGVRRRRRRCGRRRWRCLDVTGPGGKSQRRWGCTSRRGLVGLDARLVGPAVSDDQSENHDDGDDCCQPRPDRSRAVGPLDIESTERIGAARIGVAGLRHNSPPFLGGQLWC